MPTYAYKSGLARVRPGVPWHYLFRHRGRTYQGSTGCVTHGDAVAWLRRYRSQLALAEVGLADVPTLQQVWDAWQASATHGAEHVRRTSQAMRDHILPIAGRLRNDQIDNSVVDEILSTYLRKGRSPHGANGILAYLRLVVLFAVRNDWVPRKAFTTKPIKAQQPVRTYLPVALVPSVLAVVDRTRNQHLHVIVRAMLWMGLREDEALGMRWQWFGGDLETYTPGKTKGKEAVVLPVKPELRELIRQLPACGPWLFPADTDGALPRPHASGYTRDVIVRAGVAVGLQGLSPHRLRTTCATLMAKAGVPVPTIQKQLRHKRIETTMRYIQVGLEDLEAAMARTWGTS